MVNSVRHHRRRRCRCVCDDRVDLQTDRDRDSRRCASCSCDDGDGGASSRPSGTRPRRPSPSCRACRSYRGRICQRIYKNLHQSVLLYLPLPVSLSVSPVQILTGALHVVAQIVAGARHAGRIQRLLAAQSVVRAVLRGGFMQILPCLAVVSVKCKATSFCQSHNSPWLSRDTNLLSPLREPEVELSKLATVLQSGEARWR